MEWDLKSLRGESVLQGFKNRGNFTNGFIQTTCLNCQRITHHSNLVVLYFKKNQSRFWLKLNCINWSFNQRFLQSDFPCLNFHEDIWLLQIFYYKQKKSSLN